MPVAYLSFLRYGTSLNGMTLVTGKGTYVSSRVVSLLHQPASSSRLVASSVLGQVLVIDKWTEQRFLLATKGGRQVMLDLGLFERDSKDSDRERDLFT